MAGILELSDDEFKATVMDMLRPKTDKVDSIQEKMGSLSRRKKILRKKKEMLEIKDTKTEIKNILNGLVLDCTWLRKEPLTLRISQYKLPKPNKRK